ncbi:glycosyltransferase family 2 protein [Pseudonocardia sp.]|uniref:glycosyltransferase family 2 protein n=1 Tax=Pseudonocardia sp. TaxID=60912 RepID=UPI003D1209BB
MGTESDRRSAAAVVTVTCDAGDTLARLLDSLEAASECTVPVLVADLGSTDGAPERAERRAGVRVLRMREALPHAAAVNRAVAELGRPGGCPAGWIAVTDPGVEWPDGTLDALLTVAARHPRAGALAPELRLPDGAVRPSAFELPTVADVLRRRPFVPAPRREGPVGWLATTCLLLRRAAWESVDGPDARHPPPYDAVDLGERLARAGWLSVTVPSVGVTAPARAPTSRADAGRRYVLSHLPGLARPAARLALRAPERHP